MNVSRRVPQMTRDTFLAWAEAQPGRHEFDGFQPVAMGNVNVNHGLITNAIHRALFDRLRGAPLHPMGPEVGMATVGDTVRNPDAMVTCSKVAGTDYLVPGVLVVFEVVSPTSGRLDRIVKVREYGAVPTVRRYVIVESTSMDLTVLSRDGEGQAFRTEPLTAAETLRLPELGIEVPVRELYQGADLLEEG